MTTSQKTSFKSEIERLGGPKSAVNRAYQEERLISDMYNLIIGKFLEKEAAGELSRAELARLTGKRPEQISRWLGAPCNWTLSTISNLLLAIAEENLEPASRSIHVKLKRNATVRDMLKEERTTKKRADQVETSMRHPWFITDADSQSEQIQVNAD